MIVFGLLLQLGKIAGIVDSVQVWALLLFLVSGSVIVLARMWRMRLKPAQLRRPPYQIDLLSPSWRRWVLDEDQRPKNSN